MPWNRSDETTAGTSGSSSAPMRITEQNARKTLENYGYRNVTGLHQETNGTWMGRATYQGRQVNVGVDQSGHVMQL
jgi:hypothetical protein